MGRVFLILLLLLGWIGFGTYHWTCNVHNLCEDGFLSVISAGTKTEKSVTLKKPVRNKKGKMIGPTSGFSVIGDGLNVSSKDNIKFELDSFNPIISNSINKEFAKVKSYLFANSNYNLEINGHYKKGSVKPVGQVNLGLARANAVKTHLLKKGFKINNIITKSSIVNNPIILEEKVLDGVSFRLIKTNGRNKQPVQKTQPTVTNKSTSNNTAVTKKPIRSNSNTTNISNRGGIQNNAQSFNSNSGMKLGTVYELKNISFNPSSASLTPSSINELKKFVNYLQRNNLNFEIGVYTNNRGNAKSALSLSQKQANTIRFYLMGKGINGTRITSKGYGNNSKLKVNGTKVEVKVK